MKRYFTYKDEKSDKFWSIEVQKNQVLVVFGKTGTAGNTNIKIFQDEQTAIKEADKLIQEKSKKGYLETVTENAGHFEEAEFWNLIERAKAKAEDVEEQVSILEEMLSTRSEGDIVQFQNIYFELKANSYQSDLWAAAYIINGGCSDDGFEYFRDWLIAQGKDIFYKTMENPEYLTRIISAEDAGEIECEAMSYAAGNAYNNKTGMDIMDVSIQVPYPEIQFNWKDEGDVLKNKYPKLYKKYDGS